MNALLISGIYRPEIGGPATYIPALAEQLIAFNNKVQVVTLKNSQAQPINETWPVNYVIRDQLLPFRFARTCLLIIKKMRDSDCIFANGLFQETAIALSLSKNRSVAKVVGDPVWERAFNNGETELKIVDFNKSKLSTKHKLQRILLGWSLNKFEYITCPSLELKQLIKSWGVKKPIELIPNGISPIASNINSVEFDLISVCRLVKWKNLDKLIKACASANKSLAIVGSGPEEANLKSLASTTGGNVTFFGQLEELEVISTLQKSRAFALLSDYEGLSFSLLQAMACGLPSIVSNIKGNTDVITDGLEGLVVDANDENKVAEAIIELLDSPEKIRKFGLAALLKSQAKYSKHEQINKVISLMNNQKEI
jgi:glycosyltransferase involved in cell wall biosynthesis